jgi:flagellar basal body-associated protein FliL
VTNNMESANSNGKAATKDGSTGWIRLALLTAASAVAGGLATAWFYRKTLVRLQETGETPQNPHFGMPGEEHDEIRSGER